jgi:FHS family glucose/mannose:H+ symporter-like MFS transporter
MLTWLPERRLYRVSVVATIAAVSLLLVAHSPLTLLLGAAFTGLALAPVFPLILALFLAEIGESRNAGWVFAVAGLGGAVLSWLTGIVSTGTGSLRIGLLVPGAAALLMLGMISWRRGNHLSGPSEDQRALEPTKTGKA